jgi:hypothetical protein
MTLPFVPSDHPPLCAIEPMEVVDRYEIARGRMKANELGDLTVWGKSDWT